MATDTDYPPIFRVTATRGCIDTISLSPDDEHNVLDTCRELKMKIHRKELCITLVIYQGSLHDAQSTKYKLSQRLLSSGT